MRALGESEEESSASRWQGAFRGLLADKALRTLPDGGGLLLLLDGTDGTTRRMFVAFENGEISLSSDEPLDPDYRDVVRRRFAAEVAPLVAAASDEGNWLTHHLWIVENAGSTEHGERSDAPKRRPWVIDRAGVAELKAKSRPDGEALEGTTLLRPNPRRGHARRKRRPLAASERNASSVT